MRKATLLKLFMNFCFTFAGQNTTTRMRIWLKVNEPVDRPAGARPLYGRILHRRRPFDAAAAGQRPLWPPSPRQSWRPAGGGSPSCRSVDRHAAGQHQPKMALPAWRRYRWLTLPRPPELRANSGLTTHLPMIFLLYFALLFSSGQYMYFVASPYQLEKNPVSSVVVVSATAVSQNCSRLLFM